jgi:hypothetical protein
MVPAPAAGLVIAEVAVVPPDVTPPVLTVSPFPTRTVSPVVPGERYCGLRLLAALALAAEYGIVKLATNEPRAFAAGAPPIAGTAPPIAGAADKGEPAPLPPPQPAAASIPVNATPVRILGVIESFLSLVI